MTLVETLEAEARKLAFLERSARTPVSAAEELEYFKTQIDFIAFAGSFGYEVVGRRSSNNSTLMHGAHDKIVVAIDERNAHHVYIAVGSESDRGSVIDFAQRRLGGTLGQVRKYLRAWLGRSLDAPPPRREPPTAGVTRAGAVAHQDVLARWTTMRPYRGSFLTSRGLVTAAVSAFDVRMDDRGNACMAHVGDDGLICGWEVKNRHFTRFATGGYRSLGVGRLDGEAIRRVIVVESFIDAISYAQMFHEAGDVYASTAGALGDRGARALATLMSANLAAKLVAATDADWAGDAMALRLAMLAGARVLRHRPSAKDWNDLLLRRDDLKS